MIGGKEEGREKGKEKEKEKEKAGKKGRNDDSLEKHSKGLTM